VRILNHENAKTRKREKSIDFAVRFSEFRVFVIERLDCDSSLALSKAMFRYGNIRFDVVVETPHRWATLAFSLQSLFLAHLTAGVFYHRFE